MFGKEEKQVAIDRVDEQILLAVQNDGRLSNRALAQKIHLSPSSSWTRLNRLVESGVIKRFRAEVDPAKLGRTLEAIIAIRYRHDEVDRHEQFVAEVAAFPETLSLVHVTGATDFMLHVAIADTNALRSFVLERLLRRPEVDHVETSLVFAHYQGGAVLPLAES
jgi:DNA-binding Lrp family transcriptional regulator